MQFSIIISCCKSHYLKKKTSLQVVSAISKSFLYKLMTLPLEQSRKLHHLWPDQFPQVCSKRGSFLLITSDHPYPFLGHPWPSLVISYRPLTISLYCDMNTENPGDMHPHLAVALDSSPGIFCITVVSFLLWNWRVWVLAAPVLAWPLKPCCLVDETEPPIWWEEMTLQEIPYSSRVTKLSGNNEGMSMQRKGMRWRHSLSSPQTCWFLRMKQSSFGAWAGCSGVASEWGRDSWWDSACLWCCVPRDI